jgi:thymidylate synthase (FAD)
MKVTYEDHMGTDLSVVNAAKVSFGKRSEWENAEDVWIAPRIDATRYEMMNPWVDPVLSKQDQSLIAFLARGCTSGDWENIKQSLCDLDGTYDWECENMEEILNHIRKMPSHWSPFAHTAVTLHLKMPIFVARQIMKHTTGIEYNEISRRYVDSEPEFYVPDVWRKKADNVKQGSSDEVFTDYFYYEFKEDESVVPYRLQQGVDVGLEEVYANYCRGGLSLYEDMLYRGIAPEQARMVLPQSMYTEVIATGNLFAFANLYIQRTDSHAQKETQDLAKQIGEIIQPLYPVSWKELTK